MTPGARLSAAMELLDAVLAGEPAERALTRWARASRFAGSKDRAAVRDLVFDGLRRRRSLGWIAGAETGRGIVLAGQAAESVDLDALGLGGPHAPTPLTAEERARLTAPPPFPSDAVRLDYPDVLDAPLRAALGPAFEASLSSMQARAPVDLRANALRGTRAQAIAALATEGVIAEAHPLAPHALRVVGTPRGLATSRPYAEGLVEPQDVSSQLVAALCEARPGQIVLDYCAGGGGKTLALAADMAGQGEIYAWDANPRRMADLPERARRAGARVRTLDAPGLARLAGACDLVLADAPCTGTGAWRRKPEGKWRITPEFLAGFPPLQDRILDAASACVRPGGALAYATCSILRVENEERAAAFLVRHPDWRLEAERRIGLVDGGDGFFFARFRAPTA